MRMCALALLVMTCACAGAPSGGVPVAVVGDGEHGVLLAHEVLVGVAADSACRRAVDDEQFDSLQRSVAQVRAGQRPDFDEVQVVFAPLGAGVRLTGIVVSSEEGVDVVTLDVEPADGAAQACLMRLARRECQMAIIVRNQPTGQERTEAVFAGL